MKHLIKYLAIALLLVPFTLTAHITGQSHIDWTHNGLNVEGGPTTLSGFTIYCGQQSRVYTESEFVPDTSPRTMDFVTMGLMDGIWYCAVTATNVFGTESAQSNEVLFPMAGGVIQNPSNVPAPAAPSVTLVYSE